MKPIGSTCKIWYELRDGTTRGPAPGDLLSTAAGSAYLVKRSRRVIRRKQGPPRFELHCLRATLEEPAAERWTLVWDARI